MTCSSRWWRAGPASGSSRSPDRRSLRIVPVADFALDVTAAMLRRAALGNLNGAVDVLQANIAAGLRPSREKRAAARTAP